MLLTFFLMVVPLLSVLEETAAQTGRCQLQGCPENTDVYLKTYGYLHPNRSCTSEDIRAGLRRFQEMNIHLHGLQVTGVCDYITTLVMSLPRCGCEDIVQFEKKMMPQNLINGPQEYRLGSTTWRKNVLTWVVFQYPVNNRHLSRPDVDDAMRRALQIWADVTSLTFQQASSPTADITIEFVTGRHEPNPPFYDFDGRGNVLAHAFFSKTGVAHFDDDEYSVLNPDMSGTELYIVAAHAFGHTLGISHSNINEALMSPFYRYSENLKLHQDDIAAVQAMYGRNEAAPTNRPQPPVVTTTRPTTRSPSQPDLPATPVVLECGAIAGIVIGLVVLVAVVVSVVTFRYKRLKGSSTTTQGFINEPGEYFDLDVTTREVTTGISTYAQLQPPLNSNNPDYELSFDIPKNSGYEQTQPGSNEPQSAPRNSGYEQPQNIYPIYMEVDALGDKYEQLQSRPKSFSYELLQSGPRSSGYEQPQNSITPIYIELKAPDEQPESRPTSSGYEEPPQSGPKSSDYEQPKETSRKSSYEEPDKPRVNGKQT